MGSDDIGADDIGSDDMGSDDMGSDDIGADDIGAEDAGPEDIGADGEDAMDMALEVVLDGAAALVDAPALTDDDPQAAVHTSTSPSATETSAW